MKTSSYEEFAIDILKKDKIKFTREKTFSDLRRGRFRFDFYLDNDVILEIDGEYHWKQIRGRQALLKQQENDRRKNSYCLAHEIPLYRIPYWELHNIKSSKDFFQDKFLVKEKWHNDMLTPPSK